ncbi:hypothetical protein N2152v2_001433 [Parachlorella kessleri]
MQLPQSVIQGSLSLLSGSNACANATYDHRIDDPAGYNFCAVPNTGFDAFLFAGLAVLITCALHFSSLSAVLVLVAGAAFEAVIFPVNLGRLGNAFTLWLGMDPPDLFFYAFLPPLLLDSALTIDIFLFKKVMAQVIVYAFLVVIGSAAIMTPFLLYVLGLSSSGWRWQHGALFSAMLAPTDALAISALLKKAAGPESLTVLMEGESLLNDASGIVLFDLFRAVVRQMATEGPDAAGSIFDMVPHMTLEIARLALGGLLVGLTLGYLTLRLLRMLRWHGASTAQEAAAILAMSYLTFYAANSPLRVSGVIAVAVFGLYGNSTAHFGLGASARMRDMAVVQNTVAFSLNGIVFFFSGASAINFLVRSTETLRDNWQQVLLVFPSIYVGMFAARGLCILAFNPFFKLLGAGSLPLPAVLFATWGGLRGAVSLIMAQAVVTDDVMANNDKLLTAQMGMWTSSFVLATLLINAPTVPTLLKLTGLVRVSPVKLSIREKARRALLRYTKAAVQDLKDDEDEMLRGVDWGAVARYVDLTEDLPTSRPPGEAGDGGPGGEGGSSSSGGGGGGLPQEEGAPAAEGLPYGGTPPLAEPPFGQHHLEEGWGVATNRGPLPEELEARWSEGGLFATERQPGPLAQLGHPAPSSSHQASRKMLGASRTHLSHKWTPRASQEGAGAGALADEEAPGGGDAAGTAGTAAAAWERGGVWSELEEPLLAPTSSSSLASSPRGRDSGRAFASPAHSLTRFESRGFDEEIPFAPPRRPSHPTPGPSLPAGPHRTKSEPAFLQTVIDVGDGSSSDEDEEGSGSSGEHRSSLEAALAAQAQQPSSLRSLPPHPELPTASRERAPLPLPSWQRQPTAQHAPTPAQQEQHTQQAQQARKPPSEALVASPRAFAPLHLPLQAFPSVPSLDALGSSPGFSPSPPPPPPFSPRASASSRATNASAASGLTAAGHAPHTVPPAVAHGLTRGGSLGLTDPPLSPRAALPVSPRSYGSSRGPRWGSAFASGGGVGGDMVSSAAGTAGSAPGPPSTPRGMHGLVRTSLLPARADRTAVAHVSELMGDYTRAGTPASPPSSPRGLGQTACTSPRQAVGSPRGPALPASTPRHLTPLRVPPSPSSSSRASGSAAAESRGALGVFASPRALGQPVGSPFGSTSATGAALPARSSSMGTGAGLVAGQSTTASVTRAPAPAPAPSDTVVAPAPPAAVAGEAGEQSIAGGAPLCQGSVDAGSEAAGAAAGVLNAPAVPDEGIPSGTVTVQGIQSLQLGHGSTARGAPSYEQLAGTGRRVSFVLPLPPRAAWSAAGLRQQQQQQQPEGHAGSSSGSQPVGLRPVGLAALLGGPLPLPPAAGQPAPLRLFPSRSGTFLDAAAAESLAGQAGGSGRVERDAAPPARAASAPEAVVSSANSGATAMAEEEAEEEEKAAAAQPDRVEPAAQAWVQQQQQQQLQEVAGGAAGHPSSGDESIAGGLWQTAEVTPPPRPRYVRTPQAAQALPPQLPSPAGSGQIASTSVVAPGGASQQCEEQGQQGGVPGAAACVDQPVAHHSQGVRLPDASLPELGSLPLIHTGSPQRQAGSPAAPRLSLGAAFDSPSAGAAPSGDLIAGAGQHAQADQNQHPQQQEGEASAAVGPPPSPFEEASAPALHPAASTAPDSSPARAPVDTLDPWPAIPSSTPFTLPTTPAGGHGLLDTGSLGRQVVIPTQPGLTPLALPPLASPALSLPTPPPAAEAAAAAAAATAATRQLPLLPDSPAAAAVDPAIATRVTGPAPPGPPNLSRLSAPSPGSVQFPGAVTGMRPPPPEVLARATFGREPTTTFEPREQTDRQQRSWQPVAATRFKPWQAAAALLQRSMSSPLLGGAKEAAHPPGMTNGGGGELPGGALPGHGRTAGCQQWGEEVTAEARARLVAGLKRYFHAKRSEGLLSMEGLRILDYACDVAADRALGPLASPQEPPVSDVSVAGLRVLDWVAGVAAGEGTEAAGELTAIWHLAEQEVVGRYTVRGLAWLFFNCKRMAGRLPRALRGLLRPPLRFVASLIGTVLSRVMLVACEVAVEYWMSLTWSPQAQWLREAQQAGVLQAEIAAESQRVCKFIVDREIEAPERFQAIQSYRAAMAILRQQAAFVHQLYDSGVLDEREREALQAPINVKVRQLELQGPVWRAPSVREASGATALPWVLRSLPFLHSVPEHVFEVLLDKGQLLEYSQGEVIWSPDRLAGAPGGLGLYIVIYGLVKSSFTDHRGVTQDYFLGSGGVLGLLSSLVGEPLPGSGPAIAEANSLHKGPVVFHIPQLLIRQMRREAQAGDHDLLQLELDLFRVASLYILERLKGQVIAQVAAVHQQLAVARAKRQAIHRAAVRESARQASIQSSPQEGGSTLEEEVGHLRDRIQRDLEQALDQADDDSVAKLEHAARVADGAVPEFVPLTEEEVLRQLDPQRTWHKAQASARRVVSDMRHQLRDAELVTLRPKQRWRQLAHAVLLHGTLTVAERAAGPSSKQAAQQQPPWQPTEVASPSVLPFTPDQAAAALGLPHSMQSMGRALTASSYTAGLQGALVIICPVSGKSPADSASEVASLGQADKPGEDSPATGAGLAPAPLQPAPPLAQQQRQQPEGRPIHRVKSRRQVQAWWQGLGTGVMGVVSGNRQLDASDKQGYTYAITCVGHTDPTVPVVVPWRDSSSCMSSPVSRLP